jgi:hypothetical protein
MKKVFLISFILVGFTSFSQKKELTLKDAVMQQWRSFRPDYVNNFQWIPGTDSYSYLSKNWQTLYLSSVDSEKEMEALTIQQFNESMKTQFVGFMDLKWLNKNQFILTDGKVYVKYAPITKIGEILQKLPDAAENATSLTQLKMTYTLTEKLLPRIKTRILYPDSPLREMNSVFQMVFFGLKKEMCWLFIKKTRPMFTIIPYLISTRHLANWFPSNILWPVKLLSNLRLAFTT